MYQPSFPQYAQPYGTMQYQQPSMPPQMPMAAQQPQQQRGIVGRMVGAPTDIQPQELPMDGTVAFFPVSDGSAVYARALNPDFTVSTVKFVPAADEPSEEAPSGPTLADVLDGLDDLKSMIQGNTQAAPKPARRTAKKGSDDDSE